MISTMEKEYVTTNEEGINHFPHLPQEFFDARSAIYIFLNTIEVILSIRLLMKIFAPDSGIGLVGFVYSATNPLVSYFYTFLPAPSFQGAIIEWPAMLAMVTYALIAYLLVYALRRLMLHKI